MTRPFQQWTVLPHGKLEQIDENILTVVGEIRLRSPIEEHPRQVLRGVGGIAEVSTTGSAGPCRGRVCGPSLVFLPSSTPKEKST